jgi:hypothetical protein
MLEKLAKADTTGSDTMELANVGSGDTSTSTVCTPCGSSEQVTSSEAIPAGGSREVECKVTGVAVSEDAMASGHSTRRRQSNVLCAEDVVLADLRICPWLGKASGQKKIMIVTAAKRIIPTASRAVTTASSTSNLTRIGGSVLLKGCELQICIDRRYAAVKSEP